jgi:hypothetical protein
MSEPIVVNIPDDDNVMYINGNLLAEIITGEVHTDHDVIVQIPVVHNNYELLEYLNQSDDDAG